MIGQTLSRISKMEQEQRIQEIQSSRRINQRWVDTLGGVYRYRHPHASVEGTIPAGKIPSGPTRWWYCGKQPPIASDRTPGVGCVEGPPPY